mmetsp:Transcript_100893/g.284653  ORF Transcript_100893/g.284653 Transcript_100893/m.284653 type:complete len:96 (-) Transcript_100893:840-1127(-)
MVDVLSVNFRLNRQEAVENKTLKGFWQSGMHAEEFIRAFEGLTERLERAVCTGRDETDLVRRKLDADTIPISWRIPQNIQGLAIRPQVGSGTMMS